MLYSLITFSSFEASSLIRIQSCSGESNFWIIIPLINSSGSSSPTEFNTDFKLSPVFSSVDINIYLSGFDLIFSTMSLHSSFYLSGK